MKDLFLVVLLVSMLLMIGCDSQNDEDKTSLIHEISISNGNLVGNTNRVVIKKGQNVKLVFRSDTITKVHLHGYDIEKTVPVNDSVEIEFSANATGKFEVTSHNIDHSSHDSGHADKEPGKTDPEAHAAIFESNTLQKGDTFSYTIGKNMEGIKIPYHDHMAHDSSGTITVSSHHGKEGTVQVKITDGENTYQPKDVVIKPGGTVQWLVAKEGRVRITSGIVPSKHENGNETHDENDQEKPLFTLEVHP